MTTKSELLKMIRKNCIACVGDQPYLVDGCTCPDCEFFEFRDGSDPRPARKGNPDNLKRARETPSVGGKKRETQIKN